MHGQPRTVLHRRGTSLAELLVAASLVVTTIGLMGTTHLAARRLIADGGRHALAVTELSNQLELLRLVPPDELERTLSELQVPEEVAARLPQVVLTAELLDDADGKRVRLSLDWHRIGDPPPLSLLGWLPSPFSGEVSPASPPSAGSLSEGRAEARAAVPDAQQGEVQDEFQSPDSSQSLH